MLYVGRGGCPAGVIMVADSLKPDSRAAVDIRFWSITIGCRLTSIRLD